MREIKFRALEVVMREWVYGHYHEGSHGHFISNADNGTLHQIDHKTLCQYIGLTS